MLRAPGAARLCERYRAGDFLVEVFYDREGRAILSDGRLCPARPEGLPELAQFDESRGGWTLRSRELDRFWTEDGTLNEEIAHGREGARVVRRFDARGAAAARGRLHAPTTTVDGPFWRRFADAEPSPYADPRIRQERGAYEGGQAVGKWTFLDVDGQIVRDVDRGVAFRDGRRGALAGALTARASGWPARARALAAEGRVRRGAGGGGARRGGERRSGGVRAVSRRTRRRAGPEREAQWGEALSQATDATVASVLDALVSGADAAACFRALASVLPVPSRRPRSWSRRRCCWRPRAA